jgi:hypothetical protein
MAGRDRAKHMRRSEIFIAFRPNNCDQLRRSGIKPFSRGWKMYRWSGGTLMYINRRHILGRNRCAGDAPAGCECIEPEVLAAMPLLRSLSQFFGVAAIQITLLRSCRYTTDGSNHCGLKQKFTPLRETLGLSGVEGRLWPLKMSKLQSPTSVGVNADPAQAGSGLAAFAPARLRRAQSSCRFPCGLHG